MYQPQWFKPYELFPKSFLESHASLNLWFVIDGRMLWTADRLRERYGRLVCNTWKWGGNSHFRGYRPPECNVGSKLSQHRFGRALDLIPLDSEVDEIRKAIIDRKYDIDFQYINAVEEDVEWLHIDCRNWNKQHNNIFTFKP